ncbi:hypothetical protein N7493_008380 [Penicillium malachiteum]|uniref:Uncharacterized protein n=1 Tax=Penicillium malachiteum TaxID=1324776 RepID=A0AAD6MTN6_9EURO|nr:hypothetical protein N7493_008380 [Penicillium malachiteum]
MDTSYPHYGVVEQLFLDIPIHQILANPPQLTLVEPWVSMYVDATRDNRFGDAIWARYHMFGDVVNGIKCNGSNNTVLEEIIEDALGYRVADTEEYFQALALYETTSPSDGHLDVLDMLRNLDEKDIAARRAQMEADWEEEEEE